MTPASEEECRSRFSGLLSLLRSSGGAVLAFSGGVDSSLLLKAMTMAGMKVLAVTASSETSPPRDVADASALAVELGVPHLVIETDELAKESFVTNPPDRCFHCKDELYGRLRDIAAANHIGTIFDGTNADDLSDYRPGRKAAALHGIRSPLAECGLGKDEIRFLSRELLLRSWDRPSSPCLASRFPYGERITPDRLRRVAKAEDCLRSLGLAEFRVRSHGDTARIEAMEKDFPLLLSQPNRQDITRALKSLGFLHVSVDLEGFRSGNLNRALSGREETVSQDRAR